MRTPPPAGLPDLQKVQYQYAMDWFKFSADQRHKMFNYMVVFSGVMFASAENSAKDQHPEIALMCCAVGIIFDVAFMLLDRRNRELVWLSESVLTYLERDFLFKKDVQVPDEFHRLEKAERYARKRACPLGGQGFDPQKFREVRLGIRLQQQYIEKFEANQIGIPAVGFRKFLHDAHKGKHRLWFSSIIPAIFIVLFILFAWFICVNNCSEKFKWACRFQPSVETDARIEGGVKSYQGGGMSLKWPS